MSRQREDPERYVRQILVNASVDRWRRLKRRPEEPMRFPGGDPPVADRAVEIADRDLLLRGLAALAARQRAVLVLRYFEDLTEAQIAEALGCSVGTVKSQAARALARLRQLTGECDAVRRDGDARAGPEARPDAAGGDGAPSNDSRAPSAGRYVRYGQPAAGRADGRESAAATDGISSVSLPGSLPSSRCSPWRHRRPRTRSGRP